MKLQKSSNEKITHETFSHETHGTYETHETHETRGLHMKLMKHEALSASSLYYSLCQFLHNDWPVDGK